MRVTPRHRFRVLSAAAAAAVLIAAASLFIPLERERFAPSAVHSLTVKDRHGFTLREFLNDDDGRGEWQPLSAVSPHFIDAVIAAEDRRFRYHPGVDPAALLRALASRFSDGRRSGGSTITQQVIRAVYRHPRTFSAKVTEAWYALRLERMMSKDEVLEQYVNRIPFGNQLVGIHAASRYYVLQPAKELSIAEAAFLAAVPNAPASLDPVRYHSRALRRQRFILGRMAEEGTITAEEHRRALRQNIPVVLPSARFAAPHAVEFAVQGVQRGVPLAELRTTFDGELYRDIQWIVRGHLERLKEKRVTNAAVVVLHNATGEVRAMTGSADYFDDAAQGKVNGALALRQPGSSVKPFTYALALEAGMTPATLLADVPTSFPDAGGSFVPVNYDREYHGPVRLRTALACSYNIPAVRLLHRLGTAALHAKLAEAGITSVTKQPEHYGYGLTLGNAEVSLLELTNAYRSFANGGEWRPISVIVSAEGIAGGPRPLSHPAESGERHPVFSPAAAALITDILSDPAARRAAFGNHFRFPFACAVKTGTTKDYRDNWAVGYTPEYTVGVWAGNFDGRPMQQVSGVTGAGQIFTDVMHLLAAKHGSGESRFPVPEGTRLRRICARSGARPTDACPAVIEERFIAGTEPAERCTVHHRYRVRGNDGTPHIETFELFSGEYREWAELTGVPPVPPGAVEITGPAPPSSRGGRPQILFPHDGAVFKIDPVLRTAYQSIRVEYASAGTSSKRTLLIDGEPELAAGDASVWWNLRRGRHRLQIAEEKAGRTSVSPPVSIYVE